MLGFLPLESALPENTPVGEVLERVSQQDRSSRVCETLQSRQVFRRDSWPIDHPTIEVHEIIYFVSPHLS